MDSMPAFIKEDISEGKMNARDPISVNDWLGVYLGYKKRFLCVLYSLNAIHSITLKVILMIRFATVVVLVELLTHPPTNPLQLQ